ncbi:hypothetical protein GWK08_08020 [Leptobacterium flavescens]|uniref:TIGR03067 domain-containing protein n=1 Tax=Leptobacterium flavescens TaxID=472055 RepID=A0A6P0ULU2_9FLAO|nr:hypothetical protein [Leptobacterium flavescens]NER13380.1 hypothetical protein [Leptobacterium flavescens]
MLGVKDFIGTWETKEFHGCVGNDHGIIVFHVSGKGMATLWKKELPNTTTFSEGKLEIVDKGGGSFSIIIDGHAIRSDFLMLEANFYDPLSTPSFISEIPDNGKRYFEKLVKKEK